MIFHWKETGNIVPENWNISKKSSTLQNINNRACFLKINKENKYGTLDVTTGKKTKQK